MRDWGKEQHVDTGNVFCLSIPLPIGVLLAGYSRLSRRLFYFPISALVLGTTVQIQALTLSWDFAMAS